MVDSSRLSGRLPESILAWVPSSTWLVVPSLLSNARDTLPKMLYNVNIF